MSKIVFDKVGVVLHAKDTKAGPLTVEAVKEILGWQTETEGEDFGKDYLFRDLEGNKVRLNNNTTNRPFRRSLALRYANEMLRGKWALNGEGLIVDRHGKVQSGQHRGVGLVFAEQLRKKNVDRNRELYGWRGPIAIEALVVTGISEKPETTDTLDLGQKRTLGDVVFRNHDFGEFSDRDQKKLSNVLAGATRLAWIRTGGGVVSDAPHFPHSEALDFMEAHPRLQEAVLFVFNEEGGCGAEGRRISSFVSLGYAAALLYLMATAKTDRAKFDEDPEALKTSLWDKACKFWTLFAAGASLDKTDPILVLRNYLPKLDASGGAGRDEIVGTIVKAWNLWIDGKPADGAKAIKVHKTKNEDGALVLDEVPRIGGLDVEVDLPEDEDEGAEPEAPVDEEPEEEAPKASKGKGKGKGKAAVKGEPLPELGVGTAVSVKCEEGDWDGTVVSEATYGNGREVVVVKSKDDGQEYEVERKDVTATKAKK